MTFEEFAEFAERFARDHGERGTLSARHLKRLAAGCGPNGTTVGTPRPATARLLERIFGTSIDNLLGDPAASVSSANHEGDELHERLRTSARIDTGVLAVVNRQLADVRELDRQVGALVTNPEVLAKTEQIKGLFLHSLSPNMRERLAAILSQLCTLAGWQALDLGQLTKAWQQYETAKTAAAESGNVALAVHARAEQAFVLLDLGDTTAAINVLETCRAQATRCGGDALRAWLAAAHGEALAAGGDEARSLTAFDQAQALPSAVMAEPDQPFVAIATEHLDRWRGHAMARLGHREAPTSLASALTKLDATFVRAEAALRVDLAMACSRAKEPDLAHEHAGRARSLAEQLGSARQLGRLQALDLSNTALTDGHLD